MCQFCVDDYLRKSRLRKKFMKTLADEHNPGSNETNFLLENNCTN